MKPFLLTLIVIITISCKNKEANQPSPAAQQSESPTISKLTYGVSEDGKTVDLYSLTNENGMTVEFITLGGIITKWTAPDKNGIYGNITLSFDSLTSYRTESPYFGAIIGRYGNRIARGKFTIDGVDYDLAKNDNSNHLHGGEVGFDKVVWKASPVGNRSVKLTYLSPDIEEGYPGNLQCSVTYTLTPDDALEVSYEATTDKKTVVNLTQHAYFNLSGDFTNTIIDHEVMIDADTYLPVDEGLIPTGELRKVEDSPFDFREAKKIGHEMDAEDRQLKIGKGYDHCWVLNSPGSFRKVASAYHSPSGRFLEVSSTEPAIQFYTGNFLDGTLPMPGGGTYAKRTGFCLETQHYPDSPNQKDFPSTILEPDEKYTSKTVFKFSVK